jgi:hypothetical protein
MKRNSSRRELISGDNVRQAQLNTDEGFVDLDNHQNDNVSGLLIVDI